MIKLFVLFIAIFATLPGDELVYLRQQLQLIETNQVVLNMFNELADDWQEYHHNKHSFDIQKLLKATEWLFNKESERKEDERELAHVIRITHILWTEGQVRSVNVLVCALLDHISEVGVSDDEILHSFGPQVVRTLNDDHGPTNSEKEHRQAHLDIAPIQSINAQMGQLAHCIDSFRHRSKFDEWTSQEAKAYLVWNQKLLNALHGANEHLEKALQNEIDLRNVRNSIL